MQFLVLYFLACALVAFAGRGRRIGFLGFFILSILLSPIISLLVVVLSAPASQKSAL
jgi:hypothetical protein